MTYNVTIQDSLFKIALGIQMEFDTISYSVNTDFNGIVVNVLDNKVTADFKIVSPDEYFKSYYYNRCKLDYKLIIELIESKDISNIKFATNLIFTSNFYEYCINRMNDEVELSIIKQDEKILSKVFHTLEPLITLKRIIRIYHGVLN